MTQEYDDNERGVAFVNDDKRSDNSPDYRGKAKVGGIWYWMSGWKQRPRNGGDPFMAWSFQEMDAEQAEKAENRGGGDGGGRRQGRQGNSRGGSRGNGGGGRQASGRGGGRGQRGGDYGYQNQRNNNDDGGYDNEPQGRQQRDLDDEVPF